MPMQEPMEQPRDFIGVGPPVIATIAAKVSALGVRLASQSELSKEQGCSPRCLSEALRTRCTGVLRKE